MVNGPLDFLFRSPNSDRSKSGSDFLVKGWRLPFFERNQERGDRRTVDGTWVYGIRRTPGLRDRARGWRTNTALGVSPVFTESTSTTTSATTTTTTTTTEKPWKLDRGDTSAIVRFIKEHKNQFVLGIGILLFLLVSICGCVCINWSGKRRKKMRRRRQQRGSRNVDEVPHIAPRDPRDLGGLQMHQLHGAMVS